VTRVSHEKDGVKVVTKTGAVFEGSMVVGADGIHSSIRKEMWRIADREKPGSIPKAEQDGKYTTSRIFLALMLMILEQCPANGDASSEFRSQPGAFLLQR
jgi:2-polyprenyl-6-methoxyphenol hydroxylase-like FAD-dependent oxidoreductase